MRQLAHLQELLHRRALEQHNGTILIASSRALCAFGFENIDLLRSAVVCGRRAWVNTTLALQAT
jgi:hypothetical protein